MKDWTVMVYMAGDNNLTGAMAETLEQIKAITKTSNVNLFVYFDGISRNVPTLYCDFSKSDSNGGPKLYRSAGIQNKLIARKGRDDSYDFNENSASMYNILNFVNWCVDRDRRHDDGNGGSPVDIRSEKRYALIFSGHSFGFQDWGLLRDDSANYYMTLPKLRWLFERITFPKDRLIEDFKKEQAKKEGKKGGPSRTTDSFRKLEKEQTTEILGKPIDLLGFDSCEMSALEIAHQFKGLAKTLVASEGVVPNSGWNYADILLRTLKEKEKEASGSTPKQVAVNFVQEFIRRQNRLALADGSTDMAAWDLDKLGTLEAAFGGLADALLKCFSERGSVVYNQMRRLLTYVHWQSQTYSYEQNVDLADLCQLLAKEIDQVESEIERSACGPLRCVRDACNAVLEAQKDCVLLTGYSGSDFQYSKGISVFFPWSLASYDTCAEYYNHLHFVKKFEPGDLWNKFLVKYLEEVSLRPANQLTPVGWDGALQMSGDSLVFESYPSILDEGNKPQHPTVVVPDPDGKRPPDTGKRPPDTGKRPPDTGKRPPDTGKGASMSVYLSRFMKLKNFEPRWNRTGFTSSKIRFANSEGPRTMKGRPEELDVMTIKTPTRIKKILNLVTFRADKLDTNGNSTHQLYLDVLNGIAQGPDPARIEVFTKLQELPLNDDKFWKVTKKNVSPLANLMTNSISAITDEPTRAALVNRLREIGGMNGAGEHNGTKPSRAGVS